VDERARTFKMGHCLGRGGFGEVYRAVAVYPSGVEAEVAVKLLRGDLGPASQAVLRLRDEGRLLARLDHPVILRVHDLTVLEGRAALVTEYIEGDDLSICMSGIDPIPPRALCEVLSQVAAGLAAAWSAEGDGGEPLRLVHRDIKPSNIRISRHGQVKLLDFGIARADVDREARTQTEMMLGSPAYMAPERFTDTAVRSASDVFGIGCVLYEGLTGQRLFADVPVLMMTTLAVDEARFDAFLAERLELLPADVDPVAQVLLLRCLAFAPHKRPRPSDLALSLEMAADVLNGRSLATWCRKRSWVVRTQMDGELQGRTLTDGTLSREVPPAQPKSGLGARAALGLVVALVLGVGVVGVVALVLVAGPWSAPDPGPSPSVVSSAPPPQVEEPPRDTASALPAAPEPVSAPPVAAPSRRAATAAPPPSAADPAPSLDPAPAAPAPAAPAADAVMVSLTGDVSVVSLTRGGDEVRLPGRAAPGSWSVVAYFDGAKGVDAGTVVIQPGADAAIHCITKFSRCQIR
jgi:serine/threonine-protein kinase